MDAELINPFVKSVENVITTMAGISLTMEKLALKTDNRTWGDVSGIIGLAGNQASGNMILSFDQPSILAIVSGMLGEKFTAIDAQVTDAVGELTNMVSGGAKAQLSEKGYSFDMATPIILVGKDIEIKQLSKAPILMVPFITSEGKFVLEASLAKEGRSR